LNTKKKVALKIDDLREEVEKQERILDGILYNHTLPEGQGERAQKALNDLTAAREQLRIVAGELALDEILKGDV
jgi:hypothetical protein